MRRMINLGALVVLAALAVGLYKAKTEADGDRAAIARLERDLAEEREAVRVMRNEISYLESPDRLRALASEHLGLELIDPLRVVTLEEAPLLIEPAIPPAEPASDVELAVGSSERPGLTPAAPERPAQESVSAPSPGPRMSLEEFNAEPLQ